MRFEIEEAKQIIDDNEERLGTYACETIKSILEDTNEKVADLDDIDDSKGYVVNAVLDYVQHYCQDDSGQKPAPFVTKPFKMLDMMQFMQQIADAINTPEE